MELWIRSQPQIDCIHKTVLINASKNEIKCVSSSHFINDVFYEYAICVGGKYVGSYKTQERVLEIMDEIQEILTQPVLSSGLAKPNVVFQMPKE